MTVDEKPSCKKCRYYCVTYYYSNSDKSHCCNYCHDRYESRGCKVEDCELWRKYPRNGRTDIFKEVNA